MISWIKKLIKLAHKFSSEAYWDNRYSKGGDSGPGSYGHLAKLKADIINSLITEKGIISAIEFGCGDGNQLKYCNYQTYTGYDVSPTAINRCQEIFKTDPTKKFFLASQYDGRKADLAISLDVIFHLIEDDVFADYMENLFQAAGKLVIIYSSNQDDPIEPSSIHVKHRKFSNWIEAHQPTWNLTKHIANPYPYNGDSEMTSFADFHIYEKAE